MLSDIADAASLPRTELLLALALRLPSADGMLTLGLHPIESPPSGSWGLDGTRHGRRVRVDVGGGLAVTTVGVPGAAFRARADGGRLHCHGTAPLPVERAIEPLGPSPRWTNLEAVGGRDGVLVARRSQTGDSWPYDLWLAERLLAVLGRHDRRAAVAMAGVGHA